MKKFWIKLIAMGGIAVVCAGAISTDDKATLKKADKAFEQKDFRQASTLYTDYLQSSPNDAEANYKAGICYLELDDPGKAKQYLGIAYTENPFLSPQLRLLLGRAHHLDADFEQAIIYYKQELSASSRRDWQYVEYLQKYMDECTAGLALREQPKLVTIHNLGTAINSEFSDYVPVLLAADSVMLYSVRKPVPSRSKKQLFSEQIRVAKYKNNAWQQAAPLPNEEGSLLNHAVVSAAPDKQELYTYLAGKGLYVVNKAATGWGKPVHLSSPFNKGTNELSIHVTDDGRFAFFSSDRPGGLGGLDLYICFKKPDGSWSEALNMGPSVNTAFDEDAPFVDTATNTLYFSSTGHNSIGGYDIFKSQIKGSTWSQAQSLGMPINSTYDDIYFILSSTKGKAFFASDRPGGQGAKDIYEADLLQPATTAF